MTEERRRWLRLSIANFLALTVGFGLGLVFDDYIHWYRGWANRPSTVPVSGSITYNGVPVAGAVVTFSPTVAGGFAASAVTDGRGNFILTTFAPKDGCCSGL